MIHCQCNFYSDSLKYHTDINVLLPKPSGGDEKFPVLFLLHGGAGDHNSWMRQTGAERYAREHGVALVMPSGHNSFYCDAVYGEAFFTYITEELVPFVRRLFPVSDKREETFFAGSSMGGYGSTLVAMKRPDLLSAFGVFSGAIDPYRIETRLREIGINEVRFNLIFGGSEIIRGGPYDLYKLVRDFPDNENKAFSVIYCGEEDTINYDMNVELYEALLEKEFESRFVARSGGHDFLFWDSCLADFFVELKKEGLVCIRT